MLSARSEGSLSASAPVTKQWPDYFICCHLLSPPSSCHKTVATLFHLLSPTVPPLLLSQNSGHLISSVVTYCPPPPPVTKQWPDYFSCCHLLSPPLLLSQNSGHLISSVDHESGTLTTELSLLLLTLFFVLCASGPH